MQANGPLTGTCEMSREHKMLLGTDLEIVDDLLGDDLVLRVNKAGALVFKAKHCNALPEMQEPQLAHFNSFAPDLMFTIGDCEEGLRHMA